MWVVVQMLQTSLNAIFWYVACLSRLTALGTISRDFAWLCCSPVRVVSQRDFMCKVWFVPHNLMKEAGEGFLALKMKLREK